MRPLTSLRRRRDGRQEGAQSDTQLADVLGRYRVDAPSAHAPENTRERHPLTAEIRRRNAGRSYTVTPHW
jgi:hypothetical protein